MPIYKLVDYLTHRNKPESDIRLGMTLMVRDEADIIEKNIRFHAAMGVEKFFIADNASIDGTREIVDSLQKEFDITLFDDPDTTRADQAKWCTRLSFEARQQGIDWVINNDADEFWMPRNGKDLKAGLSMRDGTLRVSRANVLVTELNESVFESEYITDNAVNYDTATPFGEAYVNFNLHRVLHKVMSNTHGLMRVRGGNHSAKHIVDELHRRRFSRHIDFIFNYHFAIRSYEQFEKRLLVIKKTGDAGKIRQMSGAARHWYEAASAGRIDQAYEDLVIKKDDMPVLERYAIIKHDPIIKHQLHELGLI